MKAQKLVNLTQSLEITNMDEAANCAMVSIGEITNSGDVTNTGEVTNTDEITDFC